MTLPTFYELCGTIADTVTAAVIGDIAEEDREKVIADLAEELREVCAEAGCETEEAMVLHILQNLTIEIEDDDE